MAHHETNVPNNEWARMLGDTNAVKEFRNFHWEGSFSEYLDMAKENPRITRNAFQRMYDMVLSWGTSSYLEYKKKYYPL